jgi:putative DNA primase/helicase
MRELLNAALQYAGRGLYIFPCAASAKTPLTDHGVKDATCDLEEVRQWWHRWPDANIGLACGEKSRIIFLDFDTKNGKPGRKTLDSLKSRFPVIKDTLTAETPSLGIHQGFKYVSGLRNGVDILPGLDVRTDGGYVLVAPSIVDGNPYRWIHQAPLAEMPAGLIALLQKPKSAPAVSAPPRWMPNRLQIIERAKRYVSAVPGAIEGQSGDVSTFRLACTLTRGFGLTDGEALALLLSWNWRCRPPWTETELTKKIESARRNGSEPIGARLEIQ